MEIITMSLAHDINLYHDFVRYFRGDLLEQIVEKYVINIKSCFQEGLKWKANMIC